MNGDYAFASLGSVANVRSGFAFKSSDMGDTGWPVIKIKNVIPPTVDVTECDRVKDNVIATIPGVERYAILPGDILIAMTGATVGKVGRFPLTREQFYLNQRVGKVYLTAPEKADYRFLFYVLSQETYVNEMFGTADGSAQANISGAQIEKLEIPMPSLPEQRAIAHILGTLDDKIELNRRMSETLEAMARALFKSWFVDFDPVRAKAAGRDPGLPKEIAALFPSRLVNSELGKIPEGWEVVQFADLLVESNQRIGSTEAPEYSSTNNGLQLRSERFNKTLGISSAKNKLIRRGFLVFGLSRRVLNFGLMRDELGSVSSAYKVFTVREGVLSSDLLERLMRLKLAYFYTAVSGSSREGQSVSAESLSLLKVVVPPRVVQDAFCASDTHFTERIAAKAAESHTLLALRDTLLPKLISGELRVRDTEKIAGRAA